jgi:hypothetical protein
MLTPDLGYSRNQRDPPVGRSNNKHTQEMKSFKKFLIASSLATAFAVSAHAQTIIKVTGSTAFRSAAVAGIINSLNSGATAAYTGTSGVNGAAQAVIIGTLKGGSTAVEFQLAWSGSVGGLSSTGNGFTQLGNSKLGINTLTPTTSWLSASNATGSGAAVTDTVSGSDLYTFTGGIALTGTPAFDAAAAADVTFSDTFQSSAVPLLPTGTPTLNPVSVSAEGVVGVVNFSWCKGKQPSNAAASAGWSRLTNITSGQIQSLVINGIEPLSYFTGNTADDSTVDVVLSGRNADSGTRFAALSDSFLTQTESGGGAFINPVQFALVVTSGTVTALNTTGWDVTGAGINGYNSGGTLAKAMGNPTSASAVDANGLPFIVVAYLGGPDSATLVNLGGVVLTYNGVSTNPVFAGNADPIGSGLNNLINEGADTFWEYEHIYFRSGLTGTALTALNAVATQINSTDAAAAGLVQGNLQVLRTNEFSPVIPFAP